MNYAIHDCTVIDPMDDTPPNDAYARRLWKLVRFARTAGCSDDVIRKLIQQDVERHPVIDHETIARLAIITMKWGAR